jgi:hypothetical protein
MIFAISRQPLQSKRLSVNMVGWHDVRERTMNDEGLTLRSARTPSRPFFID